MIEKLISDFIRIMNFADLEINCKSSSFSLYSSGLDISCFLIMTL